MNGLERIAAERKRQIEELGWTPEHDKEHVGGHLTRAAISYLLMNMAYDGKLSKEIYPWGTENWEKAREGKDYLRTLEVAGALIVAEIDRVLERKGLNKVVEEMPFPSGTKE